MFLKFRIGHAKLALSASGTPFVYEKKDIVSTAHELVVFADTSTESHPTIFCGRHYNHLVAVAS